MENKHLELLVCPLCKATLEYRANTQELVCKTSKLAYPIHDGIPVMMVAAARELSAEECR